MSYLFSFSRYQAKCVIKSLLRQLLTWKFKIYLDSSSKGQGKIEGKLEIQKFEYPQNKKRFLDEIKSIFQNYLRAVKKLFISGD